MQMRVNEVVNVREDDARQRLNADPVRSTSLLYQGQQRLEVAWSPDFTSVVLVIFQLLLAQ